MDKNHVVLYAFIQKSINPVGFLDSQMSVWHKDEWILIAMPTANLNKSNI